jgi:hypothetical protein
MLATRIRIWAVLAALVFGFNVCAQTQRDRTDVEQSVQQQIMALARQGLEAAQRRDPTFNDRVLTDDSLDVGVWGIWDKERSVASLVSLEKHPNVELKSFTLSDYTFRKASADVVVVAYKATLNSASKSNGQVSSVVQYNSAVWVRRGNTWQKLLSHHTTVPPKQ